MHISNNKSFSALHLNARSSSANTDPLCNLLSDLHHSFSVIGLCSKLRLNMVMTPFLFLIYYDIILFFRLLYFVNNDLVFSKMEDLSCL